MRAVYLALSLALVSLYACAKDEITSSDWKTECVGRFQIDVPGNVDIAIETLKDVYDGGASRGEKSFSDATTIEISGFSSEGVISVGPAISLKEFQKYKNKYAHPSSKDTEASLFKNGFKSDWLTGSDAFVFSGNRIYGYQNTGPRDKFLYKAGRDYFLANFSARSQFVLPKEQGICIPYGFIKDDGTRERYVGVAMRLLDHPDVEIFFKDSNASVEDPSRAPQFKGSRGHVENFWSFFRGPTMGNQLQGTLNHYHDIKLGGFTGQYAIATIVRPTDARRIKDDESESDYKSRMKQEIAEGKHPLDYGFMAYYKGDPTQKDEPDLMLYVIRTASRATAVGKQPVSEAELKEMALQIAASVKRRPVVTQ